KRVGDERGRLHRRVLARCPGARNFDHASLRVAAVPASGTTPPPPAARLVAVEKRLVAVVVVRAPEHELILDPDERLAKAPARRQERASEGQRERAGRMTYIERRAGL